MSNRVVAFLAVLKWPYILVSEIIGWAGVPDNIVTWRTVLTPYLEFLDYWIVRAFLVVSGILVLAYPRWSLWLWIRIRPLYPIFVALREDGTPRKKKELERLKDRIEIEKTYVSLVEGQHDQYKQEAEEKDKELSALRSDLKDLKQAYGRLRVQLCCSTTSPMGLSVAVQFINTSDIELAKQIKGWFFSLRGHLTKRK